jgi:beta-aspartyl-dipeptidase (metallo-type)
VLTLIEGADLFLPEPAGAGDVMLAGDRVLAIGDAVTDAHRRAAERRIEGRGQLLLPGLVDALTHPCGGGGEGGFGNRTPELTAADFIGAGITSPVGALGTDSLGRSLEVLYGSTMALRAAGLRSFMLTGAYRVPPPTLTGDVARDIYLIDPVIGVGEVAVSEHRGTQPDTRELQRLGAEAQLGGILSGRGGAVLVHVGDGETRLQPLRDAVAGSDLAPSVFYPTHVNRSTALLDEAAERALGGGFVDITVSTTPELIAAGDIAALDALKRLIAAGAPAERITLSSDAGGSLPLYLDGQLQGLTQARPDVLLELLLSVYREARELFPVTVAALSRNPAAALRLAGVGTLTAGGTADLLLLDPDAGRLSALCCAGQFLLGD